MTQQPPSKQALRLAMREKRLALAESERMAMSVAIAEQVVALPMVQEARQVHCYLSIAALGEVSTEPLLHALHAMGKKLLVPVVQGRELLSVCYEPSMPLRIGRFGQPEPERAIPADAAQLDVVVLPLLAFDEKGQRLGYGKGYYDRMLERFTLHHVTPYCIGLAFSLQQVAALPADFWDKPLDAVVHEKGLLSF